MSWEYFNNLMWSTHADTKAESGTMSWLWPGHEGRAKAQVALVTLGGSP